MPHNKSQAELFAERFHGNGWPIQRLPRHDDGLSIPKPSFTPKARLTGFIKGLMLHIIDTTLSTQRS